VKKRRSKIITFLPHPPNDTWLIKPPRKEHGSKTPVTTSQREAFDGKKVGRTPTQPGLNTRSTLPKLKKKPTEKQKGDLDPFFRLQHSKGRKDKKKAGARSAQRTAYAISKFQRAATGKNDLRRNCPSRSGTVSFSKIERTLETISPVKSRHEGEGTRFRQGRGSMSLFAKNLDCEEIFPGLLDGLA